MLNRNPCAHELCLVRTALTNKRRVKHVIQGTNVGCQTTGPNRVNVVLHITRTPHNARQHALRRGVNYEILTLATALPFSGSSLPGFFPASCLACSTTARQHREGGKCVLSTSLCENGVSCNKKVPCSHAGHAEQQQGSWLHVITLRFRAFFCAPACVVPPFASAACRIIQTNDQEDIQHTHIYVKCSTA